MTDSIAISERLIERFETKFIPEPMSGCWLWFGSTLPDGYGNFAVQRNCPVLSHRVAWTIYRGSIPENKFVLHHCDNRACVNPDHLYIGDQKMNMADRDRRNRHQPKTPRGSKNGAAKLTETNIRAIREDQRTQRKIALDYGVSFSAINLIKLRKNWRHLD